MTNDPDRVDYLRSKGKFKDQEPGEEVGEILRILFKANQFREFSDTSGMPLRTPYERVKVFYDDFECLVGYYYYMEIFPFVDNLWVSIIIENHKPQKK